jgi:hypothetical protein
MAERRLSYNYQRLDEAISEIRLIRFLRLHESWQPGFWIDTFPLSAYPPYTALSYCWGSAARTHNILLNGSRLPITGSLASFFSHLITDISTPCSPYIWIDAICINQADVEERSKQVLKMKQIYEQAESINIWLGPGDAETDAVLDELQGIMKRLGNKPQSSGALDDILRPSLQSLPLCSWKALRKIWTNPWWTRAWVIQEATTTGNHVFVRCGHRCLSFDIVNAVSRFLLSFSTSERALRASSDLPWRAIMMLNWTRELRQHIERNSTEGWLDLIQLLDAARHHDATDPRDKVYSVLALAATASDSGIRPHYTLSVEEVYVSVARYILIQSRDLRLLKFCFNSNKFEALPSWAPD